MCGIVGFTGKQNKILLKKLLKTIIHRGDDEATYLTSPGINLGMNRLAIIDLSKNLYPLKFKQYILIYNGEIYNFKTLKQKLIKKGIKFKTNSDAEIILPLFDLYKSNAFNKLDGMFSICIYDKKTKQIILARDKAGEKPLYYTQLNQNFTFASELKTLIKLAKSQSLNLKLNHSALSQYLTQGFCSKQQTLIKEFKKIPPATYLIYKIKTKQVIKKTYWKPNTNLKNTSKLSKDMLKNKLTHLIKTSVEKRLVSDVPIGCFLSGGVDSSLISYFASQKIKNLKTFSIFFPDSIKHSEKIYANKVASWLNTQHTNIPCTANSVKLIIENIHKYIDEPINDPAVLPTFLLASQARKSVKAVLTGEGADEIFAGYRRYQKELLASKLRPFANSFPLIKQTRNIIASSKYQKIFTSLSQHYSSQTIWKPSELKKLLNKHSRQLFISNYLTKYESLNPLLAMQLTDFKGYLAEQLLMKVDKITMANNLESRAPYLNSDIINFALSLPNHYKIKNIHGKYLLKKVAENFFPKLFVWRFKHGFSVPLNKWFKNELKDTVLKSIEDLNSYNQIFNINYYSHIVNQHLNKKENHADKIWSIIVLSKWLNYYKISP